jgi:hypothetical protein
MGVTLVAGLIGIAGIITFLGLMVIWVPAPPLIIICVGVIALLIYDFVGDLREESEKRRP